MNVRPDRSTALQALEARRNQFLAQNQPEQAEQVQRDLALIRKAPGNDLYEMCSQARHRGERLGNSILARDARAGWPTGPIGMGLGLVGAGALGVGAGLAATALGVPQGAVVLASVVGGLAGMSAAFLPEYLYHKAERLRGTADAIDRNYSFVLSYQAAPAAPPRLSLAEFVTLGRSREQDLLHQGAPLAADALGQVYRALETLPCESLEEAFDQVYRRAESGPDSRRWSLVLERIQESPEVLRLVEAMATVHQLDAPGSSSGVEMDDRSVRIGPVVLKRKQPQVAGT